MRIHVLNKLYLTIKKPRFQKNLIKLYRLSQSECTRNGKVCMHIGLAREKDLVACLKHELGDTIDYCIDNDQPEDFIMDSQKFSIKHSQDSLTTPVKINWNTGLYQESIDHLINHEPQHLLISYINLNKKSIQIVCVSADQVKTTIKQFGVSAFKIPSGNSRGIQFSRSAMDELLSKYYFKVLISDADLHGGMDPIERRIELLSE